MLVTSASDGIVPILIGGEITVLPRRCGDANGDGGINLGDCVYIINYAFKGCPAPDPVCLGDTNVNVGDAVYLINCTFKGGPPPVSNCCP
jgi:hypothetical protein